MGWEGREGWKWVERGDVEGRGGEKWEWYGRDREKRERGTGKRGKGREVFQQIKIYDYTRANEINNSLFS